MSKDFPGAFYDSWKCDDGFTGDDDRIENIVEPWERKHIDEMAEELRLRAIELLASAYSSTDPDEWRGDVTCFCWCSYDPQGHPFGEAGCVGPRYICSQCRQVVGSGGELRIIADFTNGELSSVCCRAEVWHAGGTPATLNEFDWQD